MPDFDTASLPGAVGPTCYARGEQRLRQGAVLSVRWDAAHGALCGTVRGSAGETYTTRVYFAPADGSPLTFEQSICSCPVAVDCKHGVAITLKAAQARATAAPPRPAAAPLTWEGSL